MSAATGRAARVLATVTLALAALTTVTACEDGEGLRDEGPSTTTGRPATTEPTATETPRQPSR